MHTKDKSWPKKVDKKLYSEIKQAVSKQEKQKVTETVDLPQAKESKRLPAQEVEP